MGKGFIEHLNAAVKKLNCGGRSQFVRDAIIEKRTRGGIVEPRRA